MLRFREDKISFKEMIALHDQLIETKASLVALGENQIFETLFDFYCQVEELWELTNAFLEPGDCEEIKNPDNERFKKFVNKIISDNP